MITNNPQSSVHTLFHFFKNAYWSVDNRLRVKAERTLYAETSGIVQAGPFKGMHYIDICAGAGPANKYLGIYEKELWPVINHFFTQNPSHVIDIGAAEGYYAIGLLSRIPNTRMTAFESDASTRNQLARMAELNAVSNRIDIRGHCHIEDLKSFLFNFSPDSPPWLIVDIEGGERELLDPAFVPALMHCPMLIELHDCLLPGCKATLASRFSCSHVIHEIPSVKRALGDVPIHSCIPNWKLKRIIRERGDVPMSWFWLWPKSLQG